MDYCQSPGEPWVSENWNISKGNSGTWLGYTDTCAPYTCFWIAYTETCESNNWKKAFFWTTNISQNSRMYISIRMWKKFFKKSNLPKHLKMCWKMTFFTKFFHILSNIYTFSNFDIWNLFSQTYDIISIHVVWQCWHMSIKNISICNHRNLRNARPNPFINEYLS